MARQAFERKNALGYCPAEGLQFDVMPITRMNHAVLYVRDVARTSAFYQDVLGFRVVHELSGRAAFLQAPSSTNDHDIGLFQIGASAGPSEAGRATVGLYHIAWEVDTLDELSRSRRGCERPEASSVPRTTAPPRRCTPTTRTVWSSRCAGWCQPIGSPSIPALTRRLDLEAEIARYGGSTRGGSESRSLRRRRHNPRDCRKGRRRLDGPSHRAASGVGKVP